MHVIQLFATFAKSGQYLSFPLIIEQFLSVFWQKSFPFPHVFYQFHLKNAAFLNREN